jgi:hypothetical protein
VQAPTKSEALTGIAAVTLEQQPTPGHVPNGEGGLSTTLSHCVMLPENDRPNGFCTGILALCSHDVNLQGILSI